MCHYGVASGTRALQRKVTFVNTAMRCHIADDAPGSLTVGVHQVLMRSF
jgi:hypothetical protein